MFPPGVRGAPLGTTAEKHSHLGIRVSLMMAEIDSSPTRPPHPPTPPLHPFKGLSGR